MEFSSGITILFWTTFLLGLRHSLDFDHLAAITDIAAAQSSRRAAFMGTLAYALGHAGIVFILGGLALYAGLIIPSAWEHILGKIVGLTLLALAIAVVYSAIKSRDQGKIVSRWRILYAFSRRVMRGLSGKSEAEDKGLEDLGFGGCLFIGFLHGIGVESPTQLLALGSAAALGNYTVGLALISVFSAGMIISNMAIAYVSIFGFQNARKRQQIFFWLSLISAALSAFIGLKLLFWQ